MRITLVLTALFVLVSAAGAELITDDFNRANADLSASPQLDTPGY